jgi:SpoVK/Ycf46/Vps4 family AAA+-type ATPase
MGPASSSGSHGTRYASSAEHLADELHRVEGLVRAQLLRFKAACPEDQRERFWHISDAQLDLLAADEQRSLESRFAAGEEIARILGWVARRRQDIDRRVAESATGSVELRLATLIEEFDLSSAERDGFLLAVLPALHSTYRRTYGILQLDPARAYGTVAFLAEMLTDDSQQLAAHLAIFAPRATLARNRLVSLGGGEDEPFGARTVTVDERVLQFLSAGDAIDGRLDGMARWCNESIDVRSLPIPGEVSNRLELLPALKPFDRELASRLRLEFLGPDPELAVRAFASVASALERKLLVVDASRVQSAGAPWGLAIDLALREARLSKAVPIFTHLPNADDADGHARVTALFDRLADFPHPAAIEGGAPAIEDGRTASAWLTFRLPLPSVAVRQAIWSAHLASEPRLPDRSTLALDLASAFQITDTQIREAVQAARMLARRRDVFAAEIAPDDLFVACRRLSAARLVAFAQRIEPRASLTLRDDIVLPLANKRALEELRNRIRHHVRVHGAMGLGPHMRLGRGVIALFVGGSGTGKTMAAEVLASEQQVDLYRVDLAALSSKWVGETERNLSKVFADAERANCMLFFDEADSVFGRRGEIREARDRWANLETNYLLQRVEEYSGVVILATNLRQNLDEAFQRRIHVVVDFPVPDAASRRALWARLLPARTHMVMEDADLDDIAQRFELTGGNIRNVVLDGCFRALAGGQSKVSLRHVIASIAREYQKTSRPVTEGNFGRYYDWAMTDIVRPVEDESTAGA